MSAKEYIQSLLSCRSDLDRDEFTKLVTMSFEVSWEGQDQGASVFSV